MNSFSFGCCCGVDCEAIASVLNQPTWTTGTLNFTQDVELEITGVVDDLACGDCDELNDNWIHSDWQRQAASPYCAWGSPVMVGCDSTAVSVCDDGGILFPPETPSCPAIRIEPEDIDGPPWRIVAGIWVNTSTLDRRVVVNKKKIVTPAILAELAAGNWVEIDETYQTDRYCDGSSATIRVRLL